MPVQDGLGASPEDMHVRKQLWIVAIAIISIQLIVALGSSRFFFNSDTIYYFARKVRGLSDVVGTLVQYDDRGNFRPFTFWISSGLLVPLGGLHPWAYHVIAASLHAVNTGFCYLLARRLTLNRLVGAMAAFFFGVHWVFFHITYGLVCLPDLTYVFFTLGALLAFDRYLAEPGWRWKAASMTAAGFAFLCKEMAVVTPLLFAALAWIRHEETAPGGTVQQRILYSLDKSRLAWGLLVLYLIHFAILGGGSILPANPAHPYAVDFSWTQLMEKSPYLAWLGNFPNFYDLSKGPSEVMRLQAAIISPTSPDRILQRLFLAENIYRWAAIGLWLPIVLWGVAQTVRRSEVRRYLPLCLGLLLSLVPVLFLARKMMPHNIYLASSGFAFWMALCLQSIQPGEKWYSMQWKGIREWAFFVFLAASLMGIYNEANRSWLIHGSLMAQTALADIRSTIPDLAPDAGLFFLKSKDEGLPWYYDGGNLFRVMLQKPRLWVRFQDRNDYFPGWVTRKSNSYILQVEGAHIYDVTDQYLLAGDRIEQDLLASFDLGSLQFNRAEIYPNYDRFSTPNGRPVFLTRIHRFNIGRRVLVTLAGASLIAKLPASEDPGALVIRACLVHDFGDGVVGRITVSDGTQEQVLMDEELLPEERKGEGRWFEKRIDLSAFHGKPLQLKIEANNRWGHNTIADWLAWNIVRVGSK
jgi:hypothetical protein